MMKAQVTVAVEERIKFRIVLEAVSVLEEDKKIYRLTNICLARINKVKYFQEQFLKIVKLLSKDRKRILVS